MARGRARLAVGQGLSVWVMEAPEGFGDSDFHAHHAIQITACLEGELALAGAGGRVAAPAIAVAADAVHRLDARGILVLVFVEPESRLGRALAETLFGAGELVPLDRPELLRHLEPLRRSFDTAPDSSELLRIGALAAAELAPAVEAKLPDPRVRRIIDYAAANLHEPLSLARADHGVYLSPSRLRHLFVEQTGLAFKTYVLWLRLVRAVQAYSEGKSLTEAAHCAGFSDSAHFSRVFRRTFGQPATSLTRI